MVVTEYERLAVAFAKAMWEWSEVENYLFTIFAAATGAPLNDWEPTRAAFFSVVNAQARLDMMNAAAVEKWHDHPHLATWTEVYAECKKQTRARGRIAHLVGYVFTSPIASEPAIARITQAPWRPDFPGSYERAKREGWSAEKLEALTHEFEVLAIKIRDFYRQLYFAPPA